MIQNISFRKKVSHNKTLTSTSLLKTTKESSNNPNATINDINLNTLPNFTPKKVVIDLN